MSTQLTGAAGEFFVAAELARRGWAPSITPSGVEGTDIMAQHAETRRVIAVQVKASKSRRFTLSVRDERPSVTMDEWYVLVSLESADSPRYWVLPRNHVTALIYTSHRVWLSKKSVTGTPHRDNPRRSINTDRLVEGEAEWARLLLSTSEIPLRLAPFYQDVFREAQDLGISFPGKVKRLRKRPPRISA
jgi:hypothetical protein